MLSLYEILKASKTGIAPDMWTALAGMNWSGKDSGAEVKELTGIPPLSFTADGTPLLDYLISGNMYQAGTPTPDNPIQPQETGEKTGNLWDSGDVTVALHERFKSIPVSLEQGAYTLSFEYKSENTGTVIVIFYNESTIIQSFNVTITNDKGSVSITSAQPITAIRLYSASGYNPSYDYAAEFTKIMLNTGTTALPYEPYGYKIPISSGGENLFDKDSIVLGSLTDNGSIVTNYLMCVSDYIRVNPNTVYTATYLTVAYRGRAVAYYDKNKSFISIGYNSVESQDGTATYTMTTPNNCHYIRVSTYIGSTNHVNEIMLNTGSTALPYEPYIEPTETNIYLGEVQTVRQIKKLVFTGTEEWSKGNYPPSGGYQFFTSKPSDIADNPDWLTTHFKKGSGLNGSAFASYLSLYPETSILPENVTANDFKAWLAAQYANGTPVTIWYVLATPETGIVNEPIRKIGDYADTVSYEQAGVDIPTNRGNTVIDVETELKPSEIYIKYQE